MTYAQAVQELEALGIMPERMPSLEPMRRALQKTGLTHLDPSRSTVIAGTNGKGSTAATLSALLHQAGVRTGLYTSPHLVTTRERMRIAETDVSEDLFIQAYLDLKPVIQSERLSHFEALTLMAAHLFFRLDPVEYVVWEVGLGGMFDATNAIPHATCAITALGLDHQNLLGPTLPEIARQKFGIIHPGSHVVSHPLAPELDAEFRATVQRTGSRSEFVPAYEFWNAPEPVLPGARGRVNTSTALTLFRALGYRPDHHLPALAKVRWPGRFSRLAWPNFPCPIYLSGDHNEPGIQSLCDILAGLSYQKIHIVVGIGQDKDASQMLNQLAQIPRHRLHLTQTPFKGRRLEDYPPVVATSQHADPLVLLRNLRPHLDATDLVVVTGSLYLVGALLKSDLNFRESLRL